MIIVIVIVIVAEILLHLEHEPTEARIGVGLFGGIIIGILLAFGIGSHLPTIPTTEKQPIVSIYTDQNQNEIYLKVMNDGGTYLLYNVMDNGVLRDRTLSIGSNKISVVYDNIDPYLVTTTFAFKESGYSWFGFLNKKKSFAFHVPETGVEADINSFLK